MHRINSGSADDCKGPLLQNQGEAWTTLPALRLLAPRCTPAHVETAPALPLGVADHSVCLMHDVPTCDMGRTGARPWRCAGETEKENPGKNKDWEKVEKKTAHQTRLDMLTM